MQVFVDCLSPTVRSRVRQVDSVCVKGSNQPMGMFTYDIALDGVAEGEWMMTPSLLLLHRMGWQCNYGKRALCLALGKNKQTVHVNLPQEMRGRVVGIGNVTALQHLSMHMHMHNSLTH